ncbi:Cof-type HAD-IIB family hydrolase [Lentilactobacillus kisonensis]|uniref:Cof-like hydrolase n=1 Tax=Lentilactobacillus kisonensis F0435 TaxID=797516 RepID=H1LK05_9LACO|nr:Cof-type HAD-IIB family hydrolase [Lentilactobacillus kisonensis]EHO47945.1 Cof-like hydrolase [Lentilactobacillus kisonensis F0435]
MYKGIAFFDLDHTLYNEQTEVDQEVADAMHQLRTNNVLPVISTGRNLFEIPTTMKKTGIDTVVSANGSYVVFEGNPVYKAVLSKEIVKKFVAFAESTNEATTVMNSEDARINFVNDIVESNYHFINSRKPPLHVTDFINHNEIIMMLINTKGPDEKYINQFNDTLTFFRNTPYSMDIVAKGSSKKRGIQKLIKNTDLGGIPTYGFGDGNNDIPMLDYVDHPVVMGNGLDQVKKYAEFITTKNSDHGIVNGLKHYNLL